MNRISFFLLVVTLVHLWLHSWATAVQSKGLIASETFRHNSRHDLKKVDLQHLYGNEC